MSGSVTPGARVPDTGLSPLAGLPAPPDSLIDVAALQREFLEREPDPGVPREAVQFGTSGHRGTPGNGSFTAAHIEAITQAICDYRRAQGILGPLYMGRDTHALSGVAQAVALGVLAANGVQTVIQREDGATPTPVISRAILVWNHQHGRPRADGVVVTPSHNPPEDGGFKYNPPNGGPAGPDATRWIQDRANEFLRGRNANVRRMPSEAALAAPTTEHADLVTPYVDDLANVVDLDAIRNRGLKIGVDPLGGAAVAYWQAIAERHRLDLTVVNPVIDPTFGFMTLDHDGRIRMDCSSPFAMVRLVGLKDRFDVACGTDPDADRHGIVTRSAGLMNPNHFLSAAIQYLIAARPLWPATAGIGKTVVSSSMIDRVTADAGRSLMEVPVGFRWFAAPLFDGRIAFGGEESAGASFLRRNGAAWTTDKDGIVMGLLAAEITAVTGKDPGEHYQALAVRFGAPCYTRIDAPATPSQKARLAALSPQAVAAAALGGEPIVARMTTAPGNGESIGGLKVMTANGWFAARPSGTEDVYKIYAESFLGAAHLDAIVAEARQIVDAALTG